MCSIGGFVANRPFDEAKRLAEALLWYGQVRGSQSGGVWLADGRDDDGVVVKRAMDPCRLVGIEAFDKAFDRPVSRVLTHTRQPTCGGRGDDQAQPFVAEKIVSVHNGMISNQEYLKREFGIDMPSGVDSELVTTYVNKHTILNINDFFTKATGVSAIGVRTPTGIYIMKDGNPLEYITLIFNKGFELTAFASTEEILMNALRFVFLIPQRLRSKTLGPEQIHRVEAHAVTPMGDKMRKPWKTYRGYHDMEDGDEYWPAGYVRSGSVVTYTPPQHQSVKPEDLPANGNGSAHESRRKKRKQRKHEKRIGFGQAHGPILGNAVSDDHAVGNGHVRCATCHFRHIPGRADLCETLKNIKSDLVEQAEEVINSVETTIQTTLDEQIESLDQKDGEA